MPAPTASALAPPARRLVAQVWAARAASESQAGDVLARVAADLRALGVPDELATLADRGVAQEREHAVLCHEVACAYDPSVTPEARAPIPDLHPDEDPVAVRWRHVIGFCCIGETFATAFLNDCRARARAPLVRRAFRDLLADEIDHARLGWAFLASRAPAARAAAADSLVPLLGGYRDHLRARAARLPELDDPAHGCPHPAGMLPLFRRALIELVLPGFAQLGIATAAARVWVDAGENW